MGDVSLRQIQKEKKEKEKESELVYATTMHFYP